MLYRAFIKSMILMIVLDGTVGKTSADKDQSKPKRKKYRINFDREYKVGQKFQLLGKASWTKTVSYATSTPQVRGRKRQYQFSINVQGKVNIVRVNEQGNATEVHLTIKRFTAKQSKQSHDKDSPFRFRLQKGDVLIFHATEDGSKYSIKGRTVMIHGTVSEVFDALLPGNDLISAERLGDRVTEAKAHEVGETWKLNVKRKMFFSSGIPLFNRFQGTATFIGMEEIRKRKLAHLQFRLRADQLKDLDLVKNGKVNLTADAYLPLDSKLPLLSMEGTISVHAKAGGETRKLSAELEIETRFERDLQPLAENK